MTPAIGLLVIGGMLLYSGWHKNTSILDVFNGTPGNTPNNGSPTVGDSSSSGAVSPATGNPVSTPSSLGDTVQLAKGVGHFEGHPVALWIVPILKYGRKHGWRGSVTSGYRTFADQTRIYNSGVRPAAKPGTSNHEGSTFPRGAVDVNDGGALAQALKGSKYEHLLVYAGAKDPVHYSHPHNGSY